MKTKNVTTEYENVNNSNLAKSIMIQGTASSVGKSLICAGLCRIFKQDGYTTAPFKSQNMALNSFITTQGHEMGRAQVVQAEAAGVEPSVLMNPVLLKPTTDRRSQVVINGKPYKNMSATEYHEFKPQLLEMVKDSYYRLAETNDIVVLEGAGSPAEINLRDNDIVNMGMAEAIDTPVILVGDIDRGGVFASVVGTIMLLSESEKKRVKGVIINKFRGDVSLLDSGIKMLEDIIKIPVLGVIPYTKLNIEEEDSVTERFNVNRQVSNSACITDVKEDVKEKIDVVVIKLPRISNFTDFNALEHYSGISLRYAGYKNEIGSPDMIILPGTKNTVEDMLYLHKSGIAEEIIRLNKNGTVIFGICGGYQMLGKIIEDPLETESNKKVVEGLGLLNTRTIFRTEKTTTQVEAKILVKDIEGFEDTRVTGYEIHMGETEVGDGCEIFTKLTGILGKPVDKVDGVCNYDKTVFGTYLHGIFDNSKFTAMLIKELVKRKGLLVNAVEAFDYQENKQKEYDKLADVIRTSIDMDKVYSILNGGCTE